MKCPKCKQDLTLVHDYLICLNMECEKLMVDREELEE